MAKITRIKASDGPSKGGSTSGKVTRRVVLEDAKSAKEKRAARKQAEKAVSIDGGGASGGKKPGETAKSTKKSSQAETGKKPFILWRPFIALGHYLRDSWRELRQVRWPNRKATWKMVLAVLIYSALFVVLISVLDLRKEQNGSKQI